MTNAETDLIPTDEELALLMERRRASAERLQERFSEPTPLVDGHDGEPPTREVVSQTTSGRYRALKYMRTGTGTSWRFTDAAKDRALAAFAQSGVKYLAAAAAGVSGETVRQHLRTDEVFAEAWEDAYGEYQARLVAEIHRRGVEGTLEPVIGRVGKDEDGVITYVRRYSDRLLEFEAKRHMPEYRDKQQVDMNVTGGVLVVHTGGGAVGQSIEEELASFDQEHRAHVEEQKALAQGAEPIDVTPRVVEPEVKDK